ncbi:MAG TPA: POTRA domain-containing protein [Pyrinomonadaceae bacterium]|nr:POTRA domain-containing protein [Pyrinomonadaceae bacterium]
MQSLKAAARLLAAASLCGALAAAATAQPARAAKYEAEDAPDANVKWADVRVEFEGNRLFTSEQLLRATNECYEGFDQAAEEFNPDRFDYCLHRGVLAFMRRAGYVRAKLGETRTLPLGSGLLVSVPVEENELYRLGRVNIEGAEHFKAERLREMLPLREGDIADAVAVLRWLEEHVKRAYADEGFIQYDYDLKPEFRPGRDGGEGVVDFAVTVNEGRQFRLGRVEFDGPADAPLDALREALGLREGEVFRRREYEDGFHRLNGLELFRADGRFEEVDRDKDVAFHIAKGASELDLTIHLTARGQERRAAR